LLGLGFGCPSRVVRAELEAGFAAVRCVMEGGGGCARALPGGAPFGSIGDGSVFFLLGFFYSARRHGWEAFLRSSSPSLSGLPSVR
jgi:hypothetical protein